MVKGYLEDFWKADSRAGTVIDGLPYGRIGLCPARKSSGSRPVPRVLSLLSSQQRRARRDIPPCQCSSPRQLRDDMIAE